MTNPFLIGPLAPERNPPIHPEYYEPRISVIEAINPISMFSTEFVTDEDNQFVVGQIVRFIIPKGDGMEGLNERQAYITQIISPTTFNATVDTTQLKAFNPSGNSKQLPFVIPVGDINSGAINASGRINNILYIEGSFINVSPE